LHDGVSPSFTPCTADSDPCTVDICFSGACAHGNFPPPFTSDGAACDDGNPCSVSDTCLGGVCQPGSPVVCTPLDDCHDAGVCTPGAGCSNPAKMDGAACDDGNLCTLTDTCQGGACTGANLVVCTALDQCHDPGTCNPGTGSCSTPNKTDGSGCDDGNLCTLTDTCQNGICTGADLLTCGDGTVQPECGEECDDGSTGDGDGCSAVCLVEPCSVCTSEPSVCVPDAGAPCDDGNVCTNDDACDAGGVCVGETKPRTGCARPVQPGGALLKIKESANPKSDQVLFKWTKGAATTKTDFGDPAFGNTDYSICVYDEVGDVPTLIFEATAPARSFCSGNFCWKGGNTGFKYRDSAGSRAGLQQIQLKAGPAGKAKVQGKAKGINLTLPSLGLAQDAVVSAQIVGSNGVCFEGQFLPPANVNRSDQFKDKGE
jgi:cysteine-rich repeat protein